MKPSVSFVLLEKCNIFVCRHEPRTFGRVHGPPDHMPYISPISCSLLHSSLWKVADKKKRKSAVLYAVLNYIVVFNIYILVSLDIFFILSKFCFCYIMLLNFLSWCFYLQVSQRRCWPLWSLLRPFTIKIECCKAPVSTTLGASWCGKCTPWPAAGAWHGK